VIVRCAYGAAKVERPESDQSDTKTNFDQGPPSGGAYDGRRAVTTSLLGTAKGVNRDLRGGLCGRRAGEEP